MLLLATITLYTIAASLIFVSGVAIGSALCNQRWSEKCSRCQSTIYRSRVFRPAIHDRPDPLSRLHPRNQP